MVSPELLRRFPFFGGLTDAQLRAISMISEEKTFAKGSTISEECEPARELFLLIDGSIDLSYSPTDELSLKPGAAKEFSAGEVNPGEIFGVCSMIEPYVNNTTAKAAVTTRVIAMNGEGLRTLINEDVDLANKLLRSTVQILMEQLIATRVQLSAAQS